MAPLLNLLVLVTLANFSLATMIQGVIDNNNSDLII